jgi:hypothetical protein
MNCDLVIADLTDHNPNVMNTLATALIDLRSEVRQRTSYRSGLLSPTLNPNPQAVTSPDTKREAEVDMKEEGIGLSEGE